MLLPQNDRPITSTTNAGPVLLQNPAMYSARRRGIIPFRYMAAVTDAPTGNPQREPRMAAVRTLTRLPLVVILDATLDAIADKTMNGKSEGMTDLAQISSASRAALEQNFAERVNTDERNRIAVSTRRIRLFLCTVSKLAATGTSDVEYYAFAVIELF